MTNPENKHNETIKSLHYLLAGMLTETNWEQDLKVAQQTYALVAEQCFPSADAVALFAAQYAQRVKRGTSAASWVAFAEELLTAFSLVQPEKPINEYGYLT